jgi:putative endopeptidase
MNLGYHIKKIGLVVFTMPMICLIINHLNHAYADVSPPPKPKVSLGSGLTLERFDKSVRPQDDFYRFVNGGWLDTFELPPEKSKYGVFNDLHERVRAQLKKIIMALDTHKNKDGVNNSAEAQKVSDAYRAFMDEEKLEQLGMKPIQSDLDDIQKITTPQQLSTYLGQSWRLGLSGPIEGWVDQDAKQPTEYILYLMQGGIGLPDRDYYLKEEDKFVEIREAYLTYLVGLLKMSDLTQSDDEASAQAKAVLSLEKKIAEAQWTRAESRQREKTYNKKSRDMLIKEFTFDWMNFLKGMSTSHETKITKVVLRQPSYFKVLVKLVAETPITTWQAYLSTRLLTHFAPYMSADWVTHHFNFYGKTISGKEKNEPRWKRGIGHVEGILGEALGKVYVAQHFKPAAKVRMEQLVNNILIAFRGGVQSLEWMGADTKKQALKKLDQFTVKIGYPNRWKDYSLLKIQAGDLIGNAKRATTFTLEQELRKLGQPIDREEWFMPPQMVNAYYNPSMNEIVFPAAILQPPFFNMNADDAVNYGGIGAVIGHEVSHGFDDQGRKSDGEGRLTDWWTENDAKRFQERAQKLSTHYEAYTPLEGMSINGALTLGENIGDLGGLTIAYKAYQLSLKGKAASVMDGFTGVQRFFLSWAQVWACKYREAELRRRLLTDPHSPTMYRVTGIIRQMPEFYEAFNLKKEDKLYLDPSKRVKIW